MVALDANPKSCIGWTRVLKSIECLSELLGFLAGIIGYIVAAGSSVVGCGVS